ncbi:hypothetical protein [Roseateles sp. LYH14W]|uniref:Uncharacterized protein n=1 Tax=Pelomonas parva TaxID=3299032 RepID=A0ABW7EZT4_9BURK
MAKLVDRSSPHRHLVPSASLKSDYEASVQARRTASTKVGSLSREQAQSYLNQRRTFESKEDDLTLALAAAR